MTRLLPSLDLIRGFEAAARLQSITKASQELFLTQSAVSRQVKALEEHLGEPLFERRHREIRLTPAGRRLHGAATESMRLLEEAARSIRDKDRGRAVTITCSIAFASLWLVPRLMEFRAKHPEIDIRIAANNRFVDLEREQIELAVRYCPPSKAPEHAKRLFGEDVFPVCSPALLKDRKKPLLEPQDLRHHVLLEYDLAERHWVIGSWAVWLEMMQLHQLRPAGSLGFNQYDTLIQAAVDGQGVALGVTPLVRRLIKRGALVAPFKGAIASPRAYHLVLARHAKARPEVLALAGWLEQMSRQETE
jgi:LysR family glycine cleavage system transcriptional activator